MQLRKYQREAVSAINRNFVSSDRQYIELPTGSGKTVTFLSYAKENKKRILIIVPSKELLKQVYESAQMFYDQDQISRKGGGYDEEIGTVHICIIFSIRDKYLDRISREFFDLMIIDEAHHVQSKTYTRMVNRMCKEQSIKILGVTATPSRLDGQLICKILGE